jgi:hypothetical protein
MCPPPFWILAVTADVVGENMKRGIRIRAKCDRKREKD